MKRSITISPPPATVDVTRLCSELAARQVAVAPGEVRVSPVALSMLYEHPAPDLLAETLVRTVVSAHDPDPPMTPKQLAAAQAKRAATETTPEGLRLQALGRLCWVGMTKLYLAHNARRARDIAEGKDVTGIPELVPFATWEECLAAWEYLVDQVAAESQSPG